MIRFYYYIKEQYRVWTRERAFVADAMQSGRRQIVQDRLRSFLTSNTSQPEIQMDTLDISEAVRAYDNNNNTTQSASTKSSLKCLWGTLFTLIAIAALVIAIIALLRRFDVGDVTGTWLTPGPAFVDPTGILGKLGQYYIDSGTQQVWFKSSTASSTVNKPGSSALATTGWSRITDGNVLGGDLSGVISNGTVETVGGLSATYISQGVQLAFSINSTLQPGQNYTLPPEISLDSILFPATGSPQVRLKYISGNYIEFDDSASGPITFNVAGSILKNGAPVGDVYAPVTPPVPGSVAIFVTANQLDSTTLIGVDETNNIVNIFGSLNAQTITVNNITVQQLINNALSNVTVNETVVREIVQDILANSTLPLNATEVQIIVQAVLANYTIPINSSLIEQVVLSVLANYTFNPNVTLIQEIVLANLANFTFNPNVTLINELIWQALLAINVTVPPPNVTLIRQIVDEELAAFNLSQSNFTLPERLVYGPVTTPVSVGTIPFFFDTSGRNITDSPGKYFSGNDTFAFTRVTASGSIAVIGAITSQGSIIAAGSITAGTTISATGSITSSSFMNTPLIISPGDLTLAPIGSNVQFSSKNIAGLNTITSSVGGTSVHTFTMTGNWNQFRITNGVTGNIRFQVAGGSNAGFGFLGYNGGNTDSGEQRDNPAKNRYRIFFDQRSTSDRLVIDMLGNSGTAEYISMGPLATSPVSFNTGITSIANVDIVGRFRSTATTGAAFFIDYPIVNTNTGPYISLGRHFTNSAGDKTGTKLKLLDDSFGIGVGGAALYFNAPSSGTHQFFNADVSNAVPSVTISSQGMVVTQNVFAKNFHTTCTAAVTGLSGFSGALSLRFWKAGYHVLLELKGSDSNIFRCTNGGGCGIFGSTTTAATECPDYLPLATSTGVYLPGFYPSNVYRVAFTSNGFLQITCSAGICGVAGGFNFGETIVDSGRSIISYFQIEL